jgi:hypothetical protein
VSKPVQDLLRAIAWMLIVTVIAGCGGGGSGGGPPATLNISAAAPGDGVVGAAYNQTIAVTGGTGARNFTISAGALAAGLALNATTGAVTGTPAGPAATANFTVTVTDSGTPQQTDSQALTLDIVNPLVFTTVALPGTSVGAAYNQSITATGGTTPYTFGIASGSLPVGIVLSANGTLAGPATEAATTRTFTVVVTDSSAPALTTSLSLTIAVTLEIVTPNLPDATGGEFYNQTLQAQGGLLPRSWLRTAGTMPAGIADPVATTGGVTGTPALACDPQTSTFTVQVSDSAAPPQVDSQAGLSITVNPPDLRIMTLSLPAGVVGVPYSAFVQATGGVPPLNFSVFSGTLPSGLSLDVSTGEISGTPDTVTFSGVQIGVTDACPVSFVQPFSMTVNPAALGRNDSIATATTLPLADATHSASISPSGNPNTFFAPDEDYYRITTEGPLRVTIDINAQVNGSPLDSVIEFVDANGVVLNTCVAPVFNSPCISDDMELGVQLDSLLEIQISAGLGATFYLHVVDWRGDARPDMLYDIVMSLSN